MKYLPYENYRLKTNLSVDEIRDRLAEEIESKKIFRFSLWENDLSKPYEGEIEYNTFRINRILGYRNPSRPIIIGTIEKDLSQTIIHIKMRMVIFVYLFMFFWFGGVTIGGIAMITTQIENGRFEPSTLFLLIFYAFGYGLTTGGFKYESIKSKRFLSELFDGEEITK